jgi:hypothetical protein
MATSADWQFRRFGCADISFVFAQIWIEDDEGFRYGSILSAVKTAANPVFGYRPLPSCEVSGESFIHHFPACGTRKPILSADDFCAVFRAICGNNQQPTNKGKAE